MTISDLGAKKRKTTVPTTRHIHSTPIVNESDSITTTTTTTTNQDNECLSREIQLTGESVSPNEQMICSDRTEHDNGNDVDDDDSMPVVAFVEEEQPIDETFPSESDTSFVIVERTDCHDDQVTFDEVNHSQSSILDSNIVLNAIDNTIQENTIDERDSNQYSSEQSPSTSTCQDNNQSQLPQIVSKKTIRKRPRNFYGKSRARSRSLKLRHAKKPRLIDEHENDDDEQSSLVVVITGEKIEQHLRTLFMTTSTNDLRRTRTRPIKTPTRLVQETIDNTTNKLIEPDSNVFDILSTTTITDTMNSNDTTDDSQSSCTYNVVRNNQSNKLGLTIKKVVST